MRKRAKGALCPGLGLSAEDIRSAAKRIAEAEPAAQDDADYIVLCANYHHRLREALGAVVDQWTNGDGTFGSIEQARALLA